MRWGHRYFRIVENQRVSADRTVQRTVCYLGEINYKQLAEWRKSLSAFDEDSKQQVSLNLFPDDRRIPGDAVDAVQVRLSGMELHRPRPFRNCWLANELGLQLGLDQFWLERLPEGRGAGTSGRSTLLWYVTNHVTSHPDQHRSG